MNISEVSKLLNSIPTTQSGYEIENFFVDSYPTPARQLVATLCRIESLHAEQLDIKAKLADPTTTPGQSLLLTRAMNDNKLVLERMSAWYETSTLKDKKKILENYDNEEKEYWSEYLGRQAALELLALGRTTKETLDKMSMLPVNEFEDCVRICVRYSNLIKDTTDSVESSMSVITAGLPKKGKP
jgi:hypothetical protein